MKKLLFKILIAKIWVIALLPLGILYRFSDFAFFILYHIVGYRRHVVDENLSNAFPEKNELERKVIAKRFFKHLCDYFFETIKLRHISEKEIKKRIICDNSLFTKLYSENRNIVGMLGHNANWEWLTSIALADDYHWTVPYHPLRSSPLFDEFMKKLRSRFGPEPVPMNQTYRRLMEISRDNKLFLTGMIADQSPPNPNNRHWINFLNQDTAVMEGSERIARKTNAAVIFCSMTKIKRGYYKVELVSITEDISQEEDFSITKKYFALLEKQIQEQPECWLWSHRRWKRKRPADASKVKN